MLGIGDLNVEKVTNLTQLKFMDWDDDTEDYVEIQTKISSIGLFKIYKVLFHTAT